MNQTLKELLAQEKFILEDMKSDNPEMSKATQIQMLSMIRSEIKHAKPKIDKNIKDLEFIEALEGYWTVDNIIGSYSIELDHESTFQLYFIPNFSNIDVCDEFDTLEGAMSFAQDLHKQNVTEFMALAREELYK